jgi:hypothetical protein
MAQTRWAGRVALAATTGAVLLTLASAPVAAHTCPAPGTGLPGALNMAAGGAGMEHAMSVDAPQGNAGMFRAVANSGCEPAPAPAGQAASATGAPTGQAVPPTGVDAPGAAVQTASRP